MEKQYLAIWKQKDVHTLLAASEPFPDGKVCDWCSQLDFDLYFLVFRKSMGFLKGQLTSSKGSEILNSFAWDQKSTFGSKKINKN